MAVAIVSVGLASLAAPAARGLAVATALAPEVPVIPEGDSLALLAAGLAALGVLGGLRRRQRP